MNIKQNKVLNQIVLIFLQSYLLKFLQDTLINSWNFKSNDLDPKTIWHGNEHATTISSTNLNQFKSEPKDIMKSMLGILHAFQFLEQVLLSNNHPSFKDVDLEVPPLSTSKHVTKRSAQQAAERVERSADYDASIDEGRVLTYFFQKMRKLKLSLLNNAPNYLVERIIQKRIYLSDFYFCRLL